MKPGRTGDLVTAKYLWGLVPSGPNDYINQSERRAYDVESTDISEAFPVRLLTDSVDTGEQQSTTAEPVSLGVYMVTKISRNWAVYDTAVTRWVINLKNSDAQFEIEATEDRRPFRWNIVNAKGEPKLTLSFA